MLKWLFVEYPVLPMRGHACWVLWAVLFGFVATYVRFIRVVHLLKFQALGFYY